MTTLPLPLRGNEERWNGQKAIPVDSSGSRLPPLFSQPPMGYRPTQAGNPPRPMAPIFFQNQFTDPYGLPQNHLPQAGVRFLPNEHRYRVSPTFPPSTNSTEGLRFVHSMSEVNDDGRHRHSMPPPPLRRPPHWEDDPYAASSFRESDIASDRGAYLGPHGHCWQSGGPHHYHRHLVCGGVSTPICGDGHCPRHLAGLLTCSGHPHHCTYRNGCYSSCADSGNRRSSSLTYIGPSTCGGNVHCSHDLPSCGHVAPVLASQATTEATIPDGRILTGQPSSKMAKGWGDVGRWLGKRFSAAKRVIPKVLKPSNTRRNEAETLSQEPPQSQADATLGAESNSEAIPAPTTTSRTGDNSNSTASESTGLNPSSSDDTNPSSLPLVNTTQESIPRPVSSASTCQCNPSTVTLHRVLQHKPFDNFELLWNVTLPPKEFVFWGPTPQEILTGRPALFPDDTLFLENATDPPIRHMFINGLGDFPLERCQGDPDPSRSKDKERHMYTSGISSEKVELRTLPWPIRVTGTSTPHGYITLWDILRTIYLNFQQYMRKEEYELYIIERKRLIASAYHQRKRVLDGKRNYRPIYGHIPATEIMENYIEDGYMRCDYLGSSIIFRGLEVSPDGIGYTLFLGPN